jgi:hypothetical protein
VEFYKWWMGYFGFVSFFSSPWSKRGVEGLGYSKGWGDEGIPFK